ncbi:centromere kinetochore component CENP-T-domain-containing protein [Schizothecium vesticola]|uniref:Centromere kinetochore component CENP-T-domain-containing protein n=1 Tax=Schizothecium vesticola TaxID=314040 RepID=A0AA40F1Y0_9PEZI|nr:centromere kinetochore component CENP-T-domain-containing protein [Schizothecium vesticola]
MARESHPPPRDPDSDATPIRRAASFEPTTASAESRRSLLLRTPGSTVHPRPPGLSASGRKPAPGPSATPHARAAFRTIDSRRAAISTPHRAGRRRSVREARETPRDTLLSLGRALARTTQTIATSSSSPKSEDATPDGAGHAEEDDDDDDELPRPPRLSLPIDRDDVEDDDELRPHQSAGLEDENFTMRSIELGRRAYSEQPGGRFSMGSMRMSEYFEDEAGSDEGGIDPSFFRPNATNDDTGYDMADYERSEFDVQGRELLARESDFGFEVPLDMANDTTVMAPELQESPVRQPPELFEPMLDPQSDDDNGNDFGNDYGDDFGGQDDGGLEDIPEGESGAEEARVDETGVNEMGVDASGVDETTFTQSAANRTTAKKRTIKMSRHGIAYPSLPPAVVKRLAQTFAKTSGAKGKITPDALEAIMQASDWFFQQTSETLERYANHAHRKTIDESDMLTLLKKYDPHSLFVVQALTHYRQRQVSSHVTPFALAQRHLPRELLQELRMTPPVLPKKRRKTTHDAQDEEVT